MVRNRSTYRSLDITNAYLLSGVAIRIVRHFKPTLFSMHSSEPNSKANTMGLSKPAEDIDVSKQEERRCTWWTIVLLERLFICVGYIQKC